MTRLDTPWVIETAKLRRRSGTRFDVDRSAPVADVDITDAQVAPDAPVGAALVLESVGESVSATGNLTASFVAQCRRCVEDFTGTIEVKISEMFEAEPTEGETYPLGADDLDLEPMIRETLLLELPIAPLCDPNCEGPVPEAFDADRADQPTADPRWSALDALVQDES